MSKRTRASGDGPPQSSLLYQAGNVLVQEAAKWAAQYGAKPGRLWVPESHDQPGLAREVKLIIMEVFSASAESHGYLRMAIEAGEISGKE